MIEKRYQLFTKEGLKWSSWFKITVSTVLEYWQLKGKLKNEYREALPNGEYKQIKVTAKT